MGIVFSVLTGKLDMNVSGWTKNLGVAGTAANAFARAVGTAMGAARYATEQMKRAADDIAQGLTAAGAAALALAANATELAGNFEQQMARVRAVTRANTSEFVALGDAAKKMGAETEYTALDAAQALEKMALGGLNVQEAIGALPKTLNLAAAGGIEIADAARISSNVMKGMGKQVHELDHLLDVMAVAMSTSANTSLPELSEAIKQVGPLAKNMSKGMEEVTATIQLFSDVNIKGGAAGTNLRNIIQSLTGPSKEAEKAMKGLTINIDDGTGKMKSMADIVDDFSTKMAHLTEIERSEILTQIFGMRTQGAFSELLSQGGDKLREYQKRLEGSNGALLKMATIQRDTTKMAREQLLSALEAVRLEIGTRLNVEMRRFYERSKEWIDLNAELLASGFVEFWLGMADAGEKVVAAAGRLVEGMRPVLAVLVRIRDASAGVRAELTALFDRMPQWAQDLGLVVAAMIGLGSAMGRVGGMIPFLGTFLASLGRLTPYGIALLAIGTAAAQILKHWDTLLAWWNTNVDPWVAYASAVWGELASKLTAAWQAVLPQLTAAWDKATSTLAAGWAWLMANTAPARAAIADYFAVVLPAAMQLFVDAWNGAVAWVKAVWGDWAKFFADNAVVLRSIFDSLQSMFVRMMGVLAKLWPVLFQVAKWLGTGLAVAARLAMNGMQLLLGVVLQLYNAWLMFLDRYLHPAVLWLGTHLVGAVRGAATALGWLWDAFNTLMLPVMALARVIRDVLMIVLKAVWNMLVDLWMGGVQPILNGFAMLVKVIAGPVIWALKTLLWPALKALGEIFAWLMPYIGTAIGWFFKLAGVLIDVVGSALKIIIRNLGFVGEALVRVMRGDFSGLERRRREIIKDNKADWDKAFAGLATANEKKNEKIADADVAAAGESRAAKLKRAAGEQVEDLQLAGQRAKERAELEAMMAENAAMDARNRANEEERKEARRAHFAALHEAGAKATAASWEAYRQRKGAEKQQIAMDNQEVMRKAATKSLVDLPAAGGRGGVGGLGGEGGVSGGAGAEKTLWSILRVNELIDHATADNRAIMTESVMQALQAAEAMANGGRGVVQHFMAESEARIRGLGKQWAKMGVSVPPEMRKQLVGMEREWVRLQVAMSKSTGENRKKIAAELIELAKQARLQFETIRITGGQAFEKLTQKQKQELELMRAKVELEAAQMIKALGGVAEVTDKVAEAINRLGEGKVKRAGAPGFDPHAQLRGMLGQVDRAYQDMGNSLSYVAAGWQRFNTLVQETVNPVERITLQMQAQQAQLSMMQFNLHQFNQSSKYSWTQVRTDASRARQEDAIAFKQKEIERLRDARAAILAEEHRKRLLEFQRRQMSNDERSRRLAEERLLGPDVELYTGAARDVDAAETAGTARGVNAGSRMNQVNNGPLTINLGVKQRLTTDEVAQLFTDLDREAARRGVDRTGASFLRK